MWPDDGILKRKNTNTEIKIALWGKARFHSCHWCDMIIEFPYATVDHVIAIAENGDRGRDNCVLACWPCNHERGIITQLKQILKKSSGKIWANMQQWPPRLRNFVVRTDALRLCGKWRKLYEEKRMLEELFDVPNLDRQLLVHNP